MSNQGNKKASSEKHNDSPNKGETEPRVHKGGPNASNKTKGKHEKDDSSSGAEKNTTKKQENSI